MVKSKTSKVKITVDSFRHQGSSTRAEAAKSAQKRQRKRKETRGKPVGNPGNFTDAHIKLFSKYANDYCVTEGKKAQQKFWAALFPAYWKAFPWHLETEPEEFCLVAEKSKVAGRINYFLILHTD